MANLLAHALFALALHAVVSSLSGQRPLTEGAFFAAVVALLPDLELGPRHRRRTPYGHSLAFTLLWVLLALTGLSLVDWIFLPGETLPHLESVPFGLGSHLVLDALGKPGIFTWPRTDERWGRWSLPFPGSRTMLEVVVSSISGGVIVLLLLFY